MCITIIRNNEEIPYNEQRPLEEQVVNSELVVINYDPKCQDEISHFMGDVERICMNGLPCDVKIMVKTNSELRGAKLKKQVRTIEMALKFNDIIRSMALLHKETDKRLEELANMCLERK